ncbi:uncharacterized protein LY79DRAFT_142179 [Colletotrichum navitas]|uniref:Uncharacterized protein n=1 Tax=Colletotrichum navitas TaxID=681940 RepID=A0AAD8QCH4_9PEZI|nr:uncharacterized protein LY79DRAFT_142179 [Colletotrichum navitas]KAK1599486.1 hypothetical protein LY79DRAFT_142179 [Colletotrichum navitas]
MNHPSHYGTHHCPVRIRRQDLNKVCCCFTAQLLEPRLPCSSDPSGFRLVIVVVVAVSSTAMYIRYAMPFGPKDKMHNSQFIRCRYPNHGVTLQSRPIPYLEIPPFVQLDPAIAGTAANPLFGHLDSRFSITIPSPGLDNKEQVKKKKKKKKKTKKTKKRVWIKGKHW